MKKKLLKNFSLIKVDGNLIKLKLATLAILIDKSKKNILR